MSKTLTVGSCTFLYPEEGTKPGWGEEATSWAEAVSDELGTLVGPRDIKNTSVSILDNQPCATNVGSGACTLSFSNAAVRSFEATYTVTRTDPCCVITVESGTMFGAYNGTSWEFGHCHVGCAGMDFTIDACGQVQYFSDCSKGNGTIQFRAKTIDQ